MNVFFQYDAMDCGPTCLKMIAKYYERDISIDYLRDQVSLGRDGVSMRGLSCVAKK